MVPSGLTNCCLPNTEIFLEPNNTDNNFRVPGRNGWVVTTDKTRHLSISASFHPGPGAMPDTAWRSFLLPWRRDSLVLLSMHTALTASQLGSPGKEVGCQPKSRSAQNMLIFERAALFHEFGIWTTPEQSLLLDNVQGTALILLVNSSGLSAPHRLFRESPSRIRIRIRLRLTGIRVQTVPGYIVHYTETLPTLTTNWRQSELHLTEDDIKRFSAA